MKKIQTLNSTAIITVFAVSLVIKGVSRSNCYSFSCDELPFEFLYDFFKWKFISRPSMSKCLQQMFYILRDPTL